jgi:hypothetical protein
MLRKCAGVVQVVGNGLVYRYRPRSFIGVKNRPNRGYKVFPGENSKILRSRSGAPVPVGTVNYNIGSLSVCGDFKYPWLKICLFVKLVIF